MTWSELTIEQFQELYSIVSDRELDDLGKMVFCIAYLEGKTTADIEALSITEFGKLSTKYEWIKNIDLPEKCELDYTLDGKTYTITWQSDQLKTGQFIDLSEAAKDPIANMHTIMATLVYDEWANYSSGHKERAEKFRKEMTIGFAYPWAVFFCAVLVKSTPIILRWMARKARQMRREMKLQQRKDSLHTGVGTIRSMLSPRKVKNHGKVFSTGPQRNSLTESPSIKT